MNDALKPLTVKPEVELELGRGDQLLNSEELGGFKLFGGLKKKVSVEKFPGATGVLGTSMQSVGEGMAIGRTFPESLQKGMRSLESGRLGLNGDPAERVFEGLANDELLAAAMIPTPATETSFT